MAKFRCKISGNVVSFTDENDIACMRKEPDYDEVIEALTQEVQDAVQIEEVEESAPTEEVKKRGRPPKIRIEEDVNII